jgi:glutathione S-transferase
MKLYYAKQSPFARRVRMLLRERGLLSRLDEIATAPWDSPAELLAVNPTSKVPALVLDDGTALTESALIATHLDGMGASADSSARKSLNPPDAQPTREKS